MWRRNGGRRDPRPVGQRGARMRVLVVHNRYRSELPSGENKSVDQVTDMLRNAGVEVQTYMRASDEIEHFGLVKLAELAVRPIYSLEDTKAVKALIRSFDPDVVQLHNPYPLISPACIRVAKAEGVPVAQFVHNFRFVCANGLYFRDGRVCQDCLGKRCLLYTSPSPRDRTRSRMPSS